MEIDKMKAVLSDFEERMSKLENPEGSQADRNPAKQREDEFISLMKKINAGGQTDHAKDSGTAEGNGTDEDEFIADMARINRLTDEGQENNE
jgi:hypothetical protein